MLHIYTVNEDENKRVAIIYDEDSKKIKWKHLTNKQLHITEFREIMFHLRDTINMMLSPRKEEWRVDKHMTTAGKISLVLNIKQVEIFSEKEFHFYIPKHKFNISSNGKIDYEGDYFAVDLFDFLEFAGFPFARKESNYSLVAIILPGPSPVKFNAPMGTTVARDCNNKRISLNDKYNIIRSAEQEGLKVELVDWFSGKSSYIIVNMETKQIVCFNQDYTVARIINICEFEDNWSIYSAERAQYQEERNIAIDNSKAYFNSKSNGEGASNE